MVGGELDLRVRSRLLAHCCICRPKQGQPSPAGQAQHDEEASIRPIWHFVSLQYQRPSDRIDQRPLSTGRKCSSTQLAPLTLSVASETSNFSSTRICLLDLQPWCQRLAGLSLASLPGRRQPPASALCWLQTWSLA